MNKCFRILGCFFMFFLTAFLCSCQTKPDYSLHLTELRRDILAGESENLSLFATYGFNESNGNTDYFLSFKLKKFPFSESRYTVKFRFDDTDYEKDFEQLNNSYSPQCKIPVPNFNEKSLSVQIKYGSTTETIRLNSIVPEKAISYSDALNILFEKQSSLINNYYDENGVFTAKIIERITVKNGKPYYYIGIKHGENLKALLIDGLSGELLAVKEIF